MADMAIARGVAPTVPRKTHQNLPRLADTEPAAMVLAAIDAANYATNGAPFSPLMIAVAEPNDFSLLWAGGGDTGIGFFGFNGTRADGFLPLGDAAVVNGAEFPSVPVLLFKAMAGNESALAHPTSFTWILDDAGSGNPNDVDYWWPIAPAGYSACGIALSGSGNPPDPNDYWCVNNSYLQSAAIAPYWSDAGADWRNDGSLSVPVLNAGEQIPGTQFLLAPTTLLSNQGGGSNFSFLLVLDKCMLPISGGAAPDPQYNPTNTQGTTTGMGVGQVAVVPCSTISDPNRAILPANSPFYYLASQPFWQCIGSYSTPAGGSFAQSVEVGTSQSSSTSVQNTTSLTVGASVGVEAGPASASLSVSYTEEMAVTVYTSAGTSSEATEIITLTLPVASITQMWQRMTDLDIYRTDGSSLVSAVYGNTDLRITQSPQA
ncbi:MAG TPA: hypothetical protein VEW26_12215 [Allosphingosinicella sp.]|nr:hypothetical protein [Allosphingosinicella sp.]